MFNASLISSEDLLEAARLAAGMQDRRLVQEELWNYALQSLRSLIPIHGPCSLIFVTDFFSAGGTFVDAVHQPKQPAIRVRLWELHMKSRNSWFERRLYAMKDNEDYGFLSLHGMLANRKILGYKVSELLDLVSIAEFAYVWVRCAPDDLWVFSLRRTPKEGSFTLRECELIKYYGQLLHALRDKWYLPGLNRLTHGEQLALRESLLGKSNKEAAETLVVAEGTYKKQLANARQTIGVSESDGDIIAKLSAPQTGPRRRRRRGTSVSPE